MTDRLDLLDYYTLLRIDSSASLDEVRSAFHRFALRYHPDNHGADPKKRERATQIFRRGAEAYRVLLEPSTRALYDRVLAEGKLRLRAEDQEEAKTRTRQADRKSSPPQSRKARAFWVEAKRAMEQQDWKQARLNLQIALTHEPESEVLQAALAEVEEALGRR